MVGIWELCRRVAGVLALRADDDVAAAARCAMRARRVIQLLQEGFAFLRVRLC